MSNPVFLFENAEKRFSTGNLLHGKKSSGENT